MEKSGFVGRIPVRNLWLLMFYASDLFACLRQGAGRGRKTARMIFRPWLRGCWLMPWRSGSGVRWALATGNGRR